ncbi:MAG: DUF2306 domain-containing protein [Caulobacteraceae bacterium]
MKTMTWSDGRRADCVADRLSRCAAALWFAIAVAGQWVFVYYILAFYWTSTLTGHFASWNRRDLIKGYVAGDTAGNLMFAGHVLVAALITTSGGLQLIPAIRARAPAFHHWNGRFFVGAAFLMAIGGLWMVWIRGSWLTYWSLASSTLLALGIMGSAALVVLLARRRRFVEHQRWALRLFILANGVWFQRLGYMAWLILARGPVGVGKHLDGPFDIVWGFGCYLLPLAFLELYLRAKRGGVWAKSTIAGGLGLAATATALGTVGAYVFMWRPMI